MNILVVDDEKNIAYAIAQILEEQKWQVTMAYDGQEGLDLALSGYYDVAVLDIMLPGLNGFEIVQNAENIFRTNFDCSERKNVV